MHIVHFWTWNTQREPVGGARAELQAPRAAGSFTGEWRNLFAAGGIQLYCCPFDYIIILFVWLDGGHTSDLRVQISLEEPHMEHERNTRMAWTRAQAVQHVTAAPPRIFERGDEIQDWLRLQKEGFNQGINGVQKQVQKGEKRWCHMWRPACVIQPLFSSQHSQHFTARHCDISGWLVVNTETI